MARARQGSAPMALSLVGSLLYIAAVAALAYGGALTSVWSNFWIGIVSAVAIVSTVALFIANLGGMMGSKMATTGAMQFGLLGGIALIALAYGAATWMVVVIIGLILTYLGSGWAMSKMER